ncbi:hypothetical protein E6H34_04210 [Candidatus Bathyarchaeota archaeon]|nr:MAG: hypothetical protein E6H34_04210 [Candidatus Bathyarchaeota archaeon]
MAFSNGGRVAFDFVSAYSAMVNSLILVSPGIRGYKAGPQEEKEWEEEDKMLSRSQELAISENRIDGCCKDGS